MLICFMWILSQKKSCSNCELEFVNPEAGYESVALLQIVILVHSTFPIWAFSTLLLLLML